MERRIQPEMSSAGMLRAPQQLSSTMTQAMLEFLVRAARPGAVVTIVTITNPDPHAESGDGVEVLPTGGAEPPSHAAGDPDDVLNLDAAAAVSGHSVGDLARLIRGGVVRNAGTKTAPRVRRRDLPDRPANQRPVLLARDSDSDMEGLFRDVLNSKLGA